MGNKVAGGIGSRVVNPQGVRNGTPARGINPAAVAQLGGVYGNHSTDHSKVLPYRGEDYLVGKTPAGGAVPLATRSLPTSARVAPALAAKSFGAVRK